MTAQTGHVTSRDGTRIGFERSGSGPPLVLIHGTSADRTRWSPVLAAFAQRFTVYAVDRRGRGLSEDAPQYAIEREYEDIAAVIDSIGSSADVVGHSYGALCTMEAALLTSNVRRLVLYEPVFRTDQSPLYEAGQRERLEAMLADGDREQALVSFLRDIVGVPVADLEAMRSAPAWASRLAAAHTIPREFVDGDYVLDPARFAGLTIPVLLLAGADSSPEFKAATREAHAALTNSRLVAMEGQGHVAISTAPDLFARRVIEFLTDPEPDAAGA